MSAYESMVQGYEDRGTVVRPSVSTPEEQADWLRQQDSLPALVRISLGYQTIKEEKAKQEPGTTPLAETFEKMRNGEF